VLACAVTVLIAALQIVACGPTKPDPTPRDVQINGNVTLSAVGQTSQLQAFFRLSDFSATEVTTRAEWTSSDPSVASVSPTGLVKAEGLGAATIAAHFQTRTGSVVVRIAVPMPFIHLDGNLTLAAIGQTQQLTVTMILVDGTSQDVTAEAQYISSDASIVEILPGGVMIARSYGAASIAAVYDGLHVAVPVSVPEPPSRIDISGRVRLPGFGHQAFLGVPGFLVTDTTSGKSVLSNAQGGYAMSGVAPGSVLTFEKAGFEPATLTVVGPYADVAVQQVIRLAAGESATTTIAPNDVSYDPAPEFHCANCRLIRVVSPAAGILSVRASTTETHALLTMWANGSFVGVPTSAGALTADIQVAGGEVVIYVQAAGDGFYVPLMLTTAFVAGSSEGDSAAELNGTRTPGSKNLTRQPRGLAERRRVGQVAAEPKEVRGVEQIEDLREDLQPGPGAAEPQELGDPHVGREDAVAERIRGRQREGLGHGLSAAKKLTGEIPVVSVHESHQIALAEPPPECADGRPRQQIARGAVAVEVHAADEH
jgi:hypothetical protein